MEKKPFVVGKNISLYSIEKDDIDFLTYCNNSVDIRDTFFINSPTNNLQQEKVFEKLYKSNLNYLPFIVYENSSMEKIGITAFHRLDLVNRATTYSIILPNKKYWGKHYGSEVTALMLSYGFDILNLNRIQLHVAIDNKPAVKIYEKNGFVKEGTLREAMYHNNKYCDFFVMSILRNEFYKKD